MTAFIGRQSSAFGHCDKVPGSLSIGCRWLYRSSLCVYAPPGLAEEWRQGSDLFAYETLI